MEYRSFFEEEIEKLNEEKSYRVFDDIESIVGSLKKDIWSKNGKESEIKVWC